MTATTLMGAAWRVGLVEAKYIYMASEVYTCIWPYIYFG